MIAVVTDSASMLPPAWRERYEILVAPMGIVLDGIAHREGVDLDTSDFYRRLAAGASVSTAAPSPGDLLACYEQAAARGADHIVSVHTGASYSSVLDAARIATREARVPVELVDTGTASFPVALCVAAAADAADAGHGTARVAGAARGTAAVVDSIFVFGVPEMALRGGRLLRDRVAPDPMTIFTLGPRGLEEHAAAAEVDAALSQMAEHVARAVAGTPARVGVGDADRPDLGDRLADLLAHSAGVADLTRYEVGPSVGAHSGPGTVGAVWAPA